MPAAAHPTPDRPPGSELGALRARLDDLAAALEAAGRAGDARTRDAAPEHRESLRNLLHYLAFRSHDLRETQQALAALGLSSLGRAEPHVLSTLNAVRHALAALHAFDATGPIPGVVPVDHAPDVLERHTARLLGPPPAGRSVRIMVTMPSEAADDPRLVRDLVAGGMDVMRINCAHDGPDAWSRMIDHLRAAAPATDRRRVLMDIEGPKLRTGPIEHAPAVVSWNPARSAVGDVTRSVLVWITRDERPVPPAAFRPDAVLPLPGAFVARLRPGTRITFTDHPGRSRVLTITATEPGGALAEARHSAYVTPGTEMHADTDPPMSCAVGALPTRPREIELRPGDRLALTADPAPGRPAVLDRDGRTVAPARLPLEPAGILADLRPGHRVMLDDGKAVGVVEQVDHATAVLRITRCRAGRIRLGPEKGINLPDTTLSLPSLSPDDAARIPFIAAHADMIGLSFVQSPADVDTLREALGAAGAPDLGLVLKIETDAAFRRLPELLMSAMRSPAVGVMIARGDLATQVGYERLAEVQEEILWFCEAAHVPVIWATQVLETLTKKGLPSRSEITDAAMGERAECVMLNKGPFVLDAVRLLDDILRRMAGHQSKKRHMLRPLSVARRFGQT